MVKSFKLFFMLGCISIFTMGTASAAPLDAVKYTRFKCANLKTYLSYLKNADKGVLEKHAVCNAAATSAARKSFDNKKYWLAHVEQSYENYFGHASATFRQEKNQVSNAPFKTLAQITKVLPKHNNMVFILTIDGGGVRGLIPALLLEHISKEVGMKVTDIFQLFGGTSTGGLISLFLNVPTKDGTPKYDIAAVVELYRNMSLKIFTTRNFLRKIRGAGGMLTARYSAKPFNQLLKQYYGNNTMAQTVRPVFVTSVAVNEKSPFIFSTFRAIRKASHNNYYMWEAARSTSAAPTYFKPFDLKLNQPMKIGQETIRTLALIDGGVGQNNPSLEAYSLAKKHFPGHKIFMLSLGTGIAESKGKYAGRGAFGGGALSMNANRSANLGSIIDNFGDNPTRIGDKHTKRLIEADGGYYFRVEPDLAKHKIALDDGSKKNMGILEEIAIETIRGDQFKHIVETIKKQLNPRNKKRKIFRPETSRQRASAEA